MSTSLSALTRLVSQEGDTPQSGAEAAVSDALDIASFLLGAAIGALVAFVIAALVSALLRGILRRSPLGSMLIKRVRTPFYVALIMCGGLLGLEWTLQGAELGQWSQGTLVSSATHLLLIFVIAAVTWIAYAAAWVFEDAARIRSQADQGRARRFETQAQVVRRLVQLIVVIIGIVTILSTFAAARQAMTTLLASAGLISVVAGLAAQQTLGNVFAGIQLAFTDAIRVGDVVVANAKGESGAIEEITLSYVVVRLWDERRLIIPSTYFTSTTFENWTRRAAAQLGTVEIQLDWAAPMALIRQKVESLLHSTDLWDGRTWNVQMTASDTSTVTVRILVSAKNSGSLWDLRCYLREHIIAWVVAEEHWTRPATRIQHQEKVSVPVDTSRAQVAALAAELRKIAGDSATTGIDEDGASALDDAVKALAANTAVDEATHAARLVAARRKAKRARRRAMADRMRELGGPETRTQVPSENLPTQVMTAGTLARVVGAPPSESTHVDATALGSPAPETAPTVEIPSCASRSLGDPTANMMAATSAEHVANATSGGKGERLYSGSPDADERSEIFAGPGADALAEREAVAKRREAEAKGIRAEGEANEAETK